MKKYQPQQFESSWIKTWQKEKLFQDIANDSTVTAENKKYLLYAFAYPSGSGLHVGHVEPVTALDILARFYRATGKKVFFPVGWDAFGLPAENYAIKTGIPPVKTTADAIDTFSSQIKRIGVSYDWATEIATCHPGYYKWTQWLFLQLYKKGLAYKKEAPVNWCPSCQTVLANEQVVDGKCERCGTEVIQKNMNQWFFKITEYQDELIRGLDLVDWPAATKQQQLNWIGKSEGITYKQKVKDMDIELDAYDSVPQTFMAQSFSVIAPEHPAVMKLVKGTKYEKEVIKFVEDFKKRKVQNKFQIDKEVEGIFTGRYIKNPFGTGDLPIWIATFVIAEYGSGFVNCSAHDERDFAFAKKFHIQLRPVMFPADPVEAEKVRNLEYCYHHDPEGILESPEEFKGRKWGEAREDVISYIEEKQFGKRTKQYKLRDWLISRQRYWGATIPIVYDPEGKAHEVKEEHLPWILPTDVDFKPTGESPLKRSKEFKERVEKLYGKGWIPEYDTMDTFVDSSWYYLRYTDSRNEKEFARKEQLDKFMPVDFYMIGPEHIVLHLLYSRFFTKFLRDEGYLKVDEPFMQMRHQGMILGPDGRKMSKSKGNVINPDEIITEYGADTLRMYEMFMGPISADKPWSQTSVQGVFRFLNRVWKFCTDETSINEKEDDEVVIKLQKTIKQVAEHTPDLKFNTSIAAMMEFINVWENKKLSLANAKKFLQIVAPYAPFMTEEIWRNILGEKESIHLSKWPTVDESKLKESTVQIPVQVDGKIRSVIEVSASDTTEETVVKKALTDEKVKQFIDTKKYKVVYIKGRILNLVITS